MISKMNDERQMEVPYLVTHLKPQIPAQDTITKCYHIPPYPGRNVILQYVFLPLFFSTECVNVQTKLNVE